MEKVGDCQSDIEWLESGKAVIMFFSFFKRRYAAKAKVKADGDLLIALLGNDTLAMATENAVKSAADGDGQNQHHSRVRTYVQKKLGMPAH